MAGVCTGQFVGPPLVRYLLAEYSLMGATLILGAIILNSCVGAALFQPVHWHMKQPSNMANALLSSKAGHQENCFANNNDIEENKQNQETPREDSAAENKRLQRVRNRRASESSNISLAISCIDLSSIPPHASTINNETDAVDNYDDDDDSVSSQPSRLRDIMVLSGRVLTSTLSDMTILKSPRALIIAIGGVCTVNGYLNLLLIAPFAIQKAGYTLQDAAWCLSSAAVTNLVARLLNSSLSDFRWFNMRLVYMFGALILAGSTCGTFLTVYSGTDRVTQRLTVLKRIDVLKG